MRLKNSIYYPLFFTFCILVALLVGSYQNLTIPASKSIIYSNKQTSVTNKEQAATNNDLLFEEKETETESETNVGLKLLTNVLPYFIAVTHSETLRPASYTSHLANKPNNPIYISVCNFRI